jgi:hypothetical protein
LAYMPRNSNDGISTINLSFDIEVYDFWVEYLRRFVRVDKKITTGLTLCRVVGDLTVDSNGAKDELFSRNNKR